MWCASPWWWWCTLTLALAQSLFRGDCWPIPFGVDLERPRAAPGANGYADGATGGRRLRSFRTLPARLLRGESPGDGVESGVVSAVDADEDAWDVLAVLESVQVLSVRPPLRALALAAAAADGRSGRGFVEPSLRLRVGLYAPVAMYASLPSGSEGGCPASESPGVKARARRRAKTDDVRAGGGGGAEEAGAGGWGGAGRCLVSLLWRARGSGGSWVGGSMREGREMGASEERGGLRAERRGGEICWEEEDGVGSAGMASDGFGARGVWQAR